MKKINKQISKISSRNNAIKLNETQMEKIIGGRSFWGYDYGRSESDGGGGCVSEYRCFFWICGHTLSYGTPIRCR